MTLEGCSARWVQSTIDEWVWRARPAATDVMIVVGAADRLQVVGPAHTATHTLAPSDASKFAATKFESNDRRVQVWIPSGE